MREMTIGDDRIGPQDIAADGFGGVAVIAAGFDLEDGRKGLPW